MLPEHLASVVADKRRLPRFWHLLARVASLLNKIVATNEERADEQKPPLTEKGRKFLEDKIKVRREELLSIISNEDEARKALQAAYEAMVIELHARRQILRTFLMNWL